MAGTGPAPTRYPIRYPIRYGLIDLGSNAIRMQVVEVWGQGRGQQRRLKRRREAVRLGDVVLNAGVIPEASTEAILAAMRSFRQHFDLLGVDEIRAVSTSAMREAQNREEIIERVQAEAGIRLRVISGEEEARLLVLAIGTRLPLGVGQSLLIDLGAGSVELSAVGGGEFKSISLPLGGLRLLHEVGKVLEDQDGARFLAALHQHIESCRPEVTELIEHWGEKEPRRFAAIGGSIEKLGKLMAADGSGQKREGLDGWSLDCWSLVELERWEGKLGRLSLEQRMQVHGLRRDRADAIVPVAAATILIGRMAGMTEVLLADVDLRDGLLQEILETRPSQ